MLLNASLILQNNIQKTMNFIVICLLNKHRHWYKYIGGLFTFPSSLRAKQKLPAAFSRLGIIRSAIFVYLADKNVSFKRGPKLPVKFHTEKYV